MSPLSYYMDALSRLHCNKVGEIEAPHKAVCLETVIWLFNSGFVKENKIYPNDKFDEVFNHIWNSFVSPLWVFKPTWENPFWHLQHEGFWHLSNGTGADVKELFDSTPTQGQLRDNGIYAYLDDDFYQLLRDSSNGLLLTLQMNRQYLLKLRIPVSNTLPDTLDELAVLQDAQNPDIAAAVKAAPMMQPGQHDTPCPFCLKEHDYEPLFSTKLSYAICDTYAVSAGHTLIIPRRHVSDYFSLKKNEKEDMWACADRVKEIIDDRFHPDSFNLGINVGLFAGQTIPHVHLHLIPRYKGDTPKPKGGVRGVIPERMGY